jgi:multidrug efflux pump subunit AcrA (membrane-fusion protein)
MQPTGRGLELRKVEQAMRIVKIVIAWAVVIGLGYLAFRFIWPLLLPEEVETDVQTTRVQRGDLREVVPADGVIEPSVLVEVKAKASGLVEEIFVEPGDTVVVGDVLVELDKEQLLARRRQAEASLAQAQASLKRTKRSTTDQQLSSQESQIRRAEINLEDAQDRYDRISGLYAKGFATDEEMVAAENSLATAQENLQQAKEQLELEIEGGEPEDIEASEAAVEIRQAELDDVLEELANTTVTAPIAGTVLTRPVELGTAVRSGTSGNSEGTVVASIGDLSTMYVRANIEETDLGKVHLGIPCRITFDAYVGWLWNGTVTKIYPQGQQNQSGTQFQIDIEIDQDQAEREGGGRGIGRGGGRPGGGPPGGGGQQADSGEGESRATGGDGEGATPPPPPAAPPLFPKMTANVEIVLQDHPDVVILPAKFVQYGEDGQKFVEILADPENPDERTRVDIETGFSDGMRFEVTSGLEGGETIVLEREIQEEARRF